MEDESVSLRRRFRDDIHGVLSRAHTRRGGAPLKPRPSPTPAKTPSQEKGPEARAPVIEPAPKAEPRVRKTIIVETTKEAENARQEVQDVRRKLARLDDETTKLTAQLKGSRASFVDQVREQGKVEAQVASILKRNSAKLPVEATREEEELSREVAKLTQELQDAKKEAAKWGGVAKRQEEMLQEESDAAKGAESFLAKHPCGEVFLLPYPDDGSDDGGYYGDAGPRRHGRRDDVALGSSDDEDYDARRGRYERSVPQAPGQKWRSPLGAGGDDDDSDGSSMPSPSGSSGPLSACASPSGDFENSRMAASLKQAAASSSSGARVGIAGGPRAATSDSEDEDSSGSAGASGSSDVRRSPSGTSGSQSGGKFKKAVHKVTAQALKESRELSQQSGVGVSASEELSSEEKLSQSGGPGASGNTVSSSGDEV